MKRLLSLFLILILSLSLFSCSKSDVVGILDSILEEIGESQQAEIDKEGYYTTKEDVGLYIHTFGQLPNNFIKKNEAIKLDWEANKGNLWDVTEKMSIGGDSFGNRENKLLKAEGRKYFECDVNYEGGFRGAERIVYSNDGLIYFTEDHYENFTLLYGDE